MSDRCHSLQPDLLVDYSDNDLDDAQRANVEDHLAECCHCRRQLERLERSLEIAEDVFREAAEGVSVAAVSLQPVRRGHWPGRVLAAALAVAAVIAIALLPRAFRDRDALITSVPDDAPAAALRDALPDVADGNVAGGDVRGGDLAQRPLGLPAVDVDPLLAEIDRAQRRARLAASLDFLSGEPALEDYAAAARQYLLANYEDPANGDGADETRTPESTRRGNL